MRVSLLLCVLLSALAFTGCKKRSKEFTKWEGQYNVLITRDGDDAYALPEMQDVINGLENVPVDSLDREKAMALAVKITSERDRLATEKTKAEAPKPPPENPFANRPSSSDTPSEPETPAVAEGEVDAGPAEPDMPTSGMDEKVFVEKFGSCFNPAPKAKLPDGREATAYELNTSAKCQKQFGMPDTTVRYLFTDRGLWGKATETLIVRDAGVFQLPLPPQPPPPPPAQPIITTPGAPQPEGYEKAP